LYAGGSKDLPTFISPATAWMISRLAAAVSYAALHVNNFAFNAKFRLLRLATIENIGGIGLGINSFMINS
jgi:hypothetical protein